MIYKDSWPWLWLSAGSAGPLVPCFQGGQHWYLVLKEVTLVLKCAVCIRWGGSNQSAMCNREGVARGKFSLPNVLQIPGRSTGNHWLWLRLLHSNHNTPYAHPLCFIPENGGSSRAVAGHSRSSWRLLTYLCHSFELKEPLLNGCQTAPFSGKPACQLTSAWPELAELVLWSYIPTKLS